MYKIVGADGKEYGPVGLEQLAQWIADGRVSLQTRVQPFGTSDWKPASEIPELAASFAALRSGIPAGPPPSLSLAGAPQRRQGLAVTSLVLGIVSCICLGPLTGIPAIICGHIAHNRSRRLPREYGGAGLAIAGLVMGYVSLVLVLALMAFYGAMLLPALSRAKGKAQEINCSNNLKMIGLSFKTWALDHQDQFPFNVKTNAGGTLELCALGPNGFDKNSARHFLVMSNELGTTKVLVCPADSKRSAVDWQHLKTANVTYQVRSGEEVTHADPKQVLAVCPIHNTILRTDGSLLRQKPGSRSD